MEPLAELFFYENFLWENYTLPGFLFQKVLPGFLPFSACVKILPNQSKTHATRGVVILKVYWLCNGNIFNWLFNWNMKTVLILDRNKYICVYIYIRNLSCSGRKIKCKKKKNLAPKEQWNRPSKQHFKILPEIIHCCPTKTSPGRCDRSWLFLSELNSHHKDLPYICLYQCLNLDQRCALKLIFLSSSPIILCFTSGSCFGAHGLSCFCMKLSCKGHLILMIRLKLFWSETLLWNGGATSSKPNVLLYRSNLPKPHQLLMQSATATWVPGKTKAEAVLWHFH